MAREFFDYDPLTGTTEYVEFAPDGSTFSITTEQDVEPFIEFAKWMANTGTGDANFRKEGWLYAIIPPVIQTELFRKGINILDKNHNKRVVDEINANYPWLKCTTRHHALAR